MTEYWTYVMCCPSLKRALDADMLVISANEISWFNGQREVESSTTCPFCDSPLIKDRGSVWQEAVRRTRAVYAGEVVQNAREVIDYLLAQVCSMENEMDSIEKKKETQR